MVKKRKEGALKIFIMKLLAFLAFVYLIDFSLGSMLKKYYFKQDSGYDYLTTYSIEKTTADILVFGSSRAVNIYNTSIIERKTGLTCYNVGRYGEHLFYHYGVLKAVTSRYKPKMIVLSFDAGNFGIDQEDYDRISVFLPYYNHHKELEPLISLKGPYERLKLISHIYPFNSLLLPIITGNSSKGKEKYANNKGFIALHKTFSGSLKTYNYEEYIQLDTQKINYFKSFISECKETGIPLFIVCPPYQIKQIGIDPSISAAIKIANENNVNFFDYSTDSFYRSKPQLFADYRHLNNNGVEIFTNKVFDRISFDKSGEGTLVYESNFIPADSL